MLLLFGFTAAHNLGQSSSNCAHAYSVLDNKPENSGMKITGYCNRTLMLSPRGLPITMHLQFNTSKCKYMTISRKRAKELPPTINLNGIPLDRVTEFKYLGILITADLSWTAHIQRRLVGMLYRQFYQDADTTTLKQLYVSNITILNMPVKFGTLTYRKM